MTARKGGKERKRRRSQVMTPECHYCGEPLDEATVDHVIPLSRGGPWSKWNLVASCAPCNIAKSDMLYEEFTRRSLPDQILDRGFRTSEEAIVALNATIDRPEFDVTGLGAYRNAPLGVGPLADAWEHDLEQLYFGLLHEAERLQSEVEHLTNCHAYEVAKKRQIEQLYVELRRSINSPTPTCIEGMV